ncbi:MAG: hypothetical protein WCC98_08955 [Candidatus Acidiferrales bacterium]
MRVLPRRSNQEVIIGELAEPYSVLEAYDRGRTKDAYLSPHALFRGMAEGNRKHATEFLEEFGPLRLLPREIGRPGEIVRVELATFWAEHRRFCLVARLFENRDTPAALRAALEEYLGLFPAWTDDRYREIHQNVKAAAARIKAELEELDARARNLDVEDLSESIRAPAHKLARAFGLDPEFMRQRLELSARRGLAQALYPARGKKPELEEAETSSELDPEFVRGRLDAGDDPHFAALLLVEKEIQHQTRSLRFVWSLDQRPRQSDRFHRHLRVDSLLSVIWEQFAMDSGAPWRICPNDGKVFYPPRADRIYCTSKEQVEASKKNYDRRRTRMRRRARKKKGRRPC